MESMLNYQFLQTFLAIYRLGSQTKAAAELHLTQPAIFQQLRNLEAQIGKSLFTKIGKHIYPTPIAHQLALKIAPHMDGVESVWKDMSDESETDKGVVYVGGIAEFFSTTIAPHLAQFLPKGIDIRFEIGHSNLLEKLIRGELDLAQFTSHVVHPGVEIETLFVEHFILVGHPKWQDKISKKSLRMKNTETLDALPWIAYDESLLFIRDYYRNVFSRSFSGHHLRLIIKDLWSIKAAVIGGLGVTVLPSYFCLEDLQKNKLKMLFEPTENLEHKFYLGWKVGALTNKRVALAREAIHNGCAIYSSLEK